MYERNNFGTGMYDPMNTYNQPMTNVIFVTSIEEALFRASSRNSEMVFFQQDRPVFYRIKVDNEGRKSWAEYEYGVKSAEDNTPVTKAEMLELSKKISIIEEKLNLTDGGQANE